MTLPKWLLNTLKSKIIIFHNRQINLSTKVHMYVFVEWNFAPILRTNIYPERFRRKWSFVKSVPASAASIRVSVAPKSSGFPEPWCAEHPVSDANIFLMFFAKQIGTKCQHF
jgi:hypothetical protein